MANKEIIYKKDTKDKIAYITLNRPERLNAITSSMMRELNEAYWDAENDEGIWVLVITGNGRALCAGADVKTMGTEESLKRRSGGQEGPPRYLSNFASFDVPQEGTPPYMRMTKPILTAVNGICCGAGLDFVSTADIVIAAEEANFFDPHVTIGIVTAREMVRMARVMPQNMATRMALMGRAERMDAQRAYELGVVSEVVPQAQLMPRATEIAQTLNKNAPMAVRGTRLGIRIGLGLPVYQAELLAEGHREKVTNTQDSIEGPRAFREKREPKWQAR